MTKLNLTEAKTISFCVSQINHNKDAQNTKITNNQSTKNTVKSNVNQ